MRVEVMLLWHDEPWRAEHSLFTMRSLQFLSQACFYFSPLVLLGTAEQGDYKICKTALMITRDASIIGNITTLTLQLFQVYSRPRWNAVAVHELPDQRRLPLCANG